MHGSQRRVRRAIAMAAASAGILVGGPATAGTGVAAPLVRVPSLHGKKLPYAEVLLRRAGFSVGREDCDCTFGVVIKSNWYVCQQWPAGHSLVKRGTKVLPRSL